MIPTAEQLLKEGNEGYPLSIIIENLTSEQIIADMIEFAKMHVTKALKAASEKAITEETWGDYHVDKKSILNAYPLENIK